MKYFLDTEFLEGKQKVREDIIVKLLWVGIAWFIVGLNISRIVYNPTIGTIISCSILILLFSGVIITHMKKPKIEYTVPTIDLISIGIVSEDGREFYEISKDFNLYEAWNRFQMKQVSGDMRNRYPNDIKEYWIRDNVILPIVYELIQKDGRWFSDVKDTGNYNNWLGLIQKEKDWSKKWYKIAKDLINKYGKSNKEIAEEIKHFCAWEKVDVNTNMKTSIEFYAYYADYDWVAFCWLFGNMIDLPKGFPMYCRDLKQMFDDKAEEYSGQWVNMLTNKTVNIDLSIKIKQLKESKDYPKQTNEHNALADAKWNKELYNFITKL